MGIMHYQKGMPGTRIIQPEKRMFHWLRLEPFVIQWPYTHLEAIETLANQKIIEEFALFSEAEEPPKITLAMVRLVLEAAAQIKAETGKSDHASPIERRPASTGKRIIKSESLSDPC